MKTITHLQKRLLEIVKTSLLIETFTKYSVAIKFILFSISVVCFYYSTNTSKTASFLAAGIIFITIFLIIQFDHFFFRSYPTKINDYTNLQEPFFLVLIGVVLMITQNTNLNFETIDWDIHSYLVASSEINNGKLPLETQWESKGPVFFYMYNFISNISNGNFIFFKLFNDLLLFFISIILFYILKIKTNSSKISFFATLLYVLLMSITWGTLEYSELYALFFISLSYLFFEKDQESNRTLIISALLLSSSTLVNQGTILFAIPFLIYLLFQKNNKRILLQKLLIFGTSFISLHLLFVLIYFSRNIFDIYFATFVSIPLGYTEATFSFLAESLVFLRSYLEHNIFLYVSIILYTTLLFTIWIKGIFSVNKFLRYDSLNTLFLISSLLFYLLGSHGFTHHLIFFVFFFPIAIGQINVRNIRNLIYLSIFIATASLFTNSFESSSYNLRNIDNLYENYPLKNLALELDSYFEEDFTVLALDYVLILHYLEKTNFSYIVHPTNHYADFITKELVQLNRIKDNNIDELICYQRDDCEEPDVIICSHRMIINGEIIKNKLFNCMVTDYKKNYFSINTKNYTFDKNLSYFYDPYKEIAVFIKDKDI